MHTLRKLPTMEPKKKNTTDQKWNGTAAQYCGSKMVLNMIRPQKQWKNQKPSSPRPSPPSEGGEGEGVGNAEGVLLAIDILFEGAAHDLQGGGPSGPDFERFGALVQ